MRSHRGLSSIIGAVFLIAIMIGALSYMTYSLEIMGNFSESLITEEVRLKDKQNEAFEISSIDITSAGKLDGVIKNTGQIPVKFTTLWIDEQGVNDVVQKFNLDTAVAPGNSFNLIDSVDFDMDATKGYNMKLVTNRGEVQSFYVNSASQEPLNLRLMAIPENIPTTFTTTLLMTVVNNMSNNNVLVNLTPNTMTCSTGCIKISGPTPASYDTLNAGDIAIFQWVYKLTGSAGTTFPFTGSLQNVPSNSDSVTVTVNLVQEANIAGQSLNSLGIGSQSFSADVFIMHTETAGLPSTGADYQLSLPLPDSTGTTITFDDGVVKKFISANATAANVNIPAGIWNASLTYNSARLPDGMISTADNIFTDGQNGGQTFHFNTLQTNNVEDSGDDPTCNVLDTAGSAGVFGGLTNAANWHSTQGVNGSGAYYFDGTGDYIRIDNVDNANQCNDPETTVFSIAGWFNATKRDSYHTTQTIISSKDGVAMDRYEVEIGDGGSTNHGVVFFTFETKDADTVTCASDKPAGNSRYMDDNWHHFVAVRYADFKCKLYIDGIEKSDNTAATSLDDRIRLNDNDMYIGSKSGSVDEFQGMIDDIMFWVKYALTSSDVTALKGANYGADAHRMTFTISNVTDNGTFVNNIKTSTNYPLPYVDQMAHTAVNDLWAGFNYTTGSIGAHTMNTVTGNRINFTMSFDSGMDLNLRIDDQLLTGTGGTILSTYLQTPAPPEDLPSYFIHKNDDKVNFYVFNAGDEGAWFTSQGTRIVFNGTGGHYAGIVYSVSDETGPPILLNEKKDGPFIASGLKGDIVFHEVRTDPSTTAPSAGNRIPIGTYDVTVFMNGYDDDGTIFVRSINLGNVFVVAP